MKMATRHRGCELGVGCGSGHGEHISVSARNGHSFRPPRAGAVDDVGDPGTTASVYVVLILEVAQPPRFEIADEITTPAPLVPTAGPPRNRTRPSTPP